MKYALKLNFSREKNKQINRYISRKLNEINGDKIYSQKHYNIEHLHYFSLQLVWMWYVKRVSGMCA